DVFACAECALITTVEPDANALAVSPPAVENAKGKLLAPKTITAPTGTSILRMSGFGGVRLLSAVSMLASTQLPSLIKVANILSWLVVRVNSPFNLAN